MKSLAMKIFFDKEKEETYIDVLTKKMGGQNYVKIKQKCCGDSFGACGCGDSSAGNIHCFMAYCIE